MKTILSFILILITFQLSAQETELSDRELVVQKDYNNKIYEVDPIFDFASIELRSRSPLDFRADSLSSIPFFTPDIDVSVKPITYKTIAEESSQRGFIKLDKGTTNPLHAQGAYSYIAPNYYTLNGRFEYDHRAQSEIEDGFVKRVEADVAMDYYLTKELKIDLGVNYNNTSAGLYGSQSLLADDYESGQTGFQEVNAQLGIGSFKTLPNIWNFGLSANLNDWWDDFKIGRERNIQTLAWVELQFNDKWSMDFRPRYETSLSKSYGDNNVVGGTMNIGFDSPAFYIAPGVRLDYFNQAARFWPDIDLRWRVSKNTEIDFRSLARTDILGTQYLSKQNTYLDLASFTVSNKEIRYEQNLSLIVDAHLSQQTKFRFQTSYAKVENGINYRQSVSDIRQFVLSNVDYQRMSIAVKIEHKVFDDLLSGNLSVQYDKFAEQTEILLYRPTLIIQPGISSSLFGDKLKLNLIGFISNPQNLEFIPIENTRAGWRKNISFDMTFLVSKNLDINFNADNIFDDRYDVWNGYTNFGRNLSGGLLLKF